MISIITFILGFFIGIGFCILVTGLVVYNVHPEWSDTKKKYVSIGIGLFIFINLLCMQYK